MKQFVFMYPVDRKFDFVISQSSYPPCPIILHEEPFKSELERVGGTLKDKAVDTMILDENTKRFKPYYKKRLNKIVGEYRIKGFQINWFVYSGDPVSDIVEVQDSDKVVDVGVDWETHSTKLVYPNEDELMDKLGKIDEIVIAGFNRFDCVRRLFENAKKRKISSSVEERLTDSYFWMNEKGVDPLNKTFIN